jgi:hypothetical protein
VVSNTARHSAEVAKAAAATAAKAGHPVHVSTSEAKAATLAIYHHALAVGFSRGFEVSAGIMLIALVVVLAVIRVTRADLAGAQTQLDSPADDVVAREAVEVELG